MAEPTFYSDGQGVRITPTRAIFGSTTYAMANITSIRRSTKSANRTPGIVIAIIGLIILLASASFESSGGVIIGGIVLGLGILIAAIAKPTYFLKITSAAGEEEPISSRDEKYIDGIIIAINEALIRRG